jgi:DNA-binding MarR family transcriptional regulator
LGGTCWLQKMTDTSTSRLSILDTLELRVYTLIMDIANDCICINLRRTTQMITQYYDTLLAPSGLKLTQFSLLHQIRLREPVRINELARVTGLDRTTMGKNLQLIARDDLITLSPGEDRRERVAQMTSKGLQALHTAYPLWKNAQATITATLGEEHLGMFLAHLSKLEEAVS